VEAGDTKASTASPLRPARSGVESKIPGSQEPGLDHIDFFSHDDADLSRPLPEAP